MKLKQIGWDNPNENTHYITSPNGTKGELPAMTTTINKDTLVKEMTDVLKDLAKAEGLDVRVTQKLSGLAADAFVTVVKNHIAVGDDVNYVNFGKWELRTRAGRMGRNPKTGEDLEILPSVNYGFSASNNLVMPSHEVAAGILAQREAEKAERKASKQA